MLKDHVFHSIGMNPASSSPSMLSSKLIMAKLVMASMPFWPPVAPLEEIERLRTVWNLDHKYIRSKFMATLYEAGKDECADNFLTKSSHLLETTFFVDAAISVACTRCHTFLGRRRMRSKELRDVLGLLDPELSDWIESHSSRYSFRKVNVDVALSSTHLLVLRILSLSSRSELDTAQRSKIHSMAVLSGTLVKTMEK